MNLMINGEQRQLKLTPAGTLEKLLNTLEIDDVRGVAVAHNGQVIPRGDWAQTDLSDGDRIEIIRATQGG